MKDLNDIRVFLSVAELGSFAAAARTLAMTAPSVTRAVGALETRLGVQLFEHVDGDFFAVLGLDLLPVLAELRRQDVLAK